MSLASKSGCLACHAIDADKIGPAWRKVGDKYKSDAHGASTIASNITRGGRFGWNKSMAMPAKGAGRATEAEIAQLAAFIAALR
ncbi:c-type cytochrome [Ferriphaselus amnicola]|uniref:c-type cytochrome n=1 Tax=Ferriphaselus amnicola TaxID=1188319 RepID=UPI001558AD91|nr:c-type cytochrome [Ferriphaselus amnicola]